MVSITLGKSESCIISKLINELNANCFNSSFIIQVCTSKLIDAFNRLVTLDTRHKKCEPLS